MQQVASRWSAPAIALGALAVLAGPSFLLWRYLTPRPFERDDLPVRFESVRYERAGLVFAYRMENRTRRAAVLQPNVTTIRLKQDADDPAAGVPSLAKPFEIAPRSVRTIEIRLELPLPRSQAEILRRSDEQTERVLQHRLPSADDFESPLAALPLTRPSAGLSASSTADPAADVEQICREALSVLDGFEMINQPLGLHVVLPRGW